MIEAFHQKYHRFNASVIGLALDGPEYQEAIDDVLARNQPSYVNLVAFSDVFNRQFMEETGKAFSVTPTYVFYRPDGSVFGVHTGKVSLAALEAVVSQ